MIASCVHNHKDIDNDTFDFKRLLKKIHKIHSGTETNVSVHLDRERPMTEFIDRTYEDRS